MKAYPGIDYTWRPLSYWIEGDLLQSILRNVKGENRRQMILDYAAQGRLEELEQDLLKDEVDDTMRHRLGRIHPSFMGGEYLPSYLPREVEVARICLQSTTSDVISVRARPIARGIIGYRAVDEYEGDFQLPISSSKLPLTLAEFIRQFDEGNMDDGVFKSGGLSLGYNVMSADASPRVELRHFTRISSMIYLQVHEHYEQVFEDWANGCTIETKE
jgi:hypothetical protein